MLKRIKLPVKFLDECFNYDPKTGILVWKTRPAKHFVSERACLAWNGRYAGTVAGSPGKDGRKWLTIREHGRILCARIAYAIHYRKDPGLKQVDHKDTDPSNDRAKNLRLATHGQNMHNQKRSRANKTGC